MGIYVWGTGCGASEVIRQGLELHRISAFIDSHPMRDFFLGKPVLLPEAVDCKDIELILVSTRHRSAVAARCHTLGFPENRILYLKNYNTLVDTNDTCTYAEELLGKDLLISLTPPQYLVTAPSSLRDPILRSNNDYVRLSTLELLTRRIADVPGAMAELGVYRGSFAACMNRLMPDRTLYLFDSFQGFEPEEAMREKGERTCSDFFLQAHKNTTVETVRSIMPHPESVVFKIGYFPESLNGMEDRFCLVSLDADFRDSTLAGLRYFWPRLSPGGYLMLHDWGSPELTGVAQALEEYQRELGCLLPGVPIPDIGNSIIVQKYTVL